MINKEQNIDHCIDFYLRRSIVCAYFRPQTSSRTQPPNEVLSLVAMFVPREARPEAERSEVTNRVVFGLITWFAGPGESSREFVYIYIYIFSRCTFAVT